MDLQQVRKMIQGSFDKQLKIHLPYAIESGPEMLERTLDTTSAHRGVAPPTTRGVRSGT